jgi:hypothetical protein
MVGHLDAELPWPEIEKHLLAPVPASLDVVIGNLSDTLGHAAAEDLRFWPIKLLDARMSDVRRVDQPPMARTRRSSAVRNRLSGAVRASRLHRVQQATIRWNGRSAATPPAS